MRKITQILSGRFIWLAVVLLLLIAGGVAYKLGSSPKTTPDVSGSPSNNGLIAASSTAPLFNVATISGQQFSLAAYKGKTIVMFGMFGSCSDCIPEGQALNQIQKTFGSKVAVIGIDVLNGEPQSALQAYEQQANIDIPLATYDQSVVSAYKLSQPEITYVISPAGKVAYASQSFTSEANLQQQVSRVINE